VSVEILVGDAIEQLRTLPDGLANTCVTSPPYWGLRDYGVDRQIGLERTPDEWAGHLVELFREVRRVLRRDGTIWVNLGDAYCSGTGIGRKPTTVSGARVPAGWTNRSQVPRTPRSPGIKTKDLCGLPWLLAFALRADGWYLRSDIIWSKPNPMPESVSDRPTKAHEYVFLLSKSPRYYYDAAAVVEPQVERERARRLREQRNGLSTRYALARDEMPLQNRQGENGALRSVAARQALAVRGTRNRRSVWTVPTHAFPGAHFATFPPKLIEPCILAGCPLGGTVLDPFGGAGTTGLVADRLGRSAVLVELNPAYAAMARERIDAASTSTEREA
jgi:DNA modification methylase